MRQILRAERGKTRRCGTSWIALALGLLILATAVRTVGNRTEELATGYSAMFYAMPIYNTIFLPVGLAVIASRIWDIESKEKNCTLLFTLQSRKSLLAAKGYLATWDNLILVLVEGMGVLAAGRLVGYTEYMDIRQLLWMLLCTALVNEMLLMAALWLSIHFENPVGVLATGIFASFSGTFTMFVSQTLNYFLPWSYYIRLVGMEMNWNEVTRKASYCAQDFQFWLLGLVIVFTLLLFRGARCELEKKEV